MKPTVFLQVRRGANPANNSPEGYRSPERSGASLRGEGQVDLSGILFSCLFLPTETLIPDSAQRQWRVFECPNIGDPKHTARLVRISDTRETEDRPWEHRVLILEADWQRLQAKTQARNAPRPAAQVIKPHASEQNFQPRRIQVVTLGEPGRHSSAHDRYGVIVFDAVTRRVVEAWERANRNTPTVGAWRTNFSHDPTGLFSAQEIVYKKDALAIAKEQSKARGLPFDERIDSVTWTDASAGPEQSCAACGEKTTQRGCEPVICADCRVSLDLGKATRADRIVVAIPTEGWLPISCLPSYFRDGDLGEREDRNAVERRLASELLGLCGVGLPQFSENAPSLGDAVYRLPSLRQGSFDPVRYTKVLLTRVQFEHLVGVLDTVRLVVSTAAIHGHETGSNLLRSLAFGKITADEFDQRVIERVGAMQARKIKAECEND